MADPGRDRIGPHIPPLCEMAIRLNKSVSQSRNCDKDDGAKENGAKEDLDAPENFGGGIGAPRRVRNGETDGCWRWPLNSQASRHAGWRTRGAPQMAPSQLRLSST